MTEKKFYQSFFAMTITLSLQNIIVFGVNLADSVMMGAYSETALSGVGICNNIQFFLMMAVVGISNGMTVITSRYWGKKDIDSIKKTAAVGVLLSIGASLLITLLCGFFPNGIIGLFTDKPSVAEQAVLYLDIIKYTYVIYAITQIILFILRSVETVKIGFFVSLSSFGINVLLNYAFIYGRLGFPEMGVRGAAYATLVARAVEMIVSVIFLLAADKKLKFKVNELFRTTGSMFKDFVKTGLPLATSSISWGIAMSVQGAIIGRLVESAIAANTIVTTMFQIASVISFAAGNAACVLIGKSLGEKSSLEIIKNRSKKLQLIFIGIGILASLILLLCKKMIIGFYDATPETLKYTNQFIWILSITIIGTSYEAPTLTGIVSGGGETSFVLKNDIIFMWLIVLPASILSAFVFKFPVAVTFACLKADQVLKCPVAFFKARSNSWIKNIGSDKQTNE